jgi:hypothetical protein
VVSHVIPYDKLKKCQIPKSARPFPPTNLQSVQIPWGRPDAAQLAKYWQEELPVMLKPQCIECGFSCTSVDKASSGPPPPTTPLGPGGATVKDCESTSGVRAGRKVVR